MRTIDKIITRVDGSRGAPMGRYNIGTKPANTKIFDRAVPMSGQGDYDKGGAYWGIGKQLRVSYTKDLSYIEFYRLGDHDILNSFAEFKNEFRLICCDTWGDALDAWFECAGHMNKRRLQIPASWGYSTGMGSNGTEKESYWHSLFSNTSDNLLVQIGSFLFRYCQYLKFKNVDY